MTAAGSRCHRPGNRPEARNLLFRLGQRYMALPYALPSFHKLGGRGCQIFEGRIDCQKGNSRDRSSTDDPALKFRDLRKRCLDRIFNSANLGRDVVGGIFNDFSSHSFSFPGSTRSGVVLAGLIEVAGTSSSGALRDFRDRRDTYRQRKQLPLRS